MSAAACLRCVPPACFPKFLHTTSQRAQKSLVTTPIFYCNAAPHLGHLYTVVLADAVTRFRRLQGSESTFLVTGTDEHGTKIMKAASGHALSPQEYCDRVSAEYRTLFSESDISYDRFLRTTERAHIESVNRFWRRLSDGGFIYKGEYSGWYCVADEAFLSESQVKDNPTADGGTCKVSIDSGQPVEWMSEENFKFRLSQFQSDILYWLQRDNVVKPEIFQRSLISWLRETELEDLSVSRPANRVPWGIPVPGNADHSVYVWLDALVNYLTAAGYPDDPGFSSNWPPSLQIVGKDIIKFHGVYWPAFLMAAGLDPPQQLLVHSHWTVNSEKMSKSKGNVVEPPSPSKGGTTHELTAMRYFLLRTGTPHKDNNYNQDLMFLEANTDLKGAIGNLLNRCTGAVLNPKQVYPPFENTLPDCNECSMLVSAIESLPYIVKQHYLEYNFHLGIRETLKVIDLANKFFTHMMPWKFSKEQLESGVQNSIIHLTMESLRVTGIALQPIIPSLASTLLSRLGIPNSQRMWSDIEKFSWQGGPSGAGYKLGLKHIKLFEKIVPKTESKVQISIEPKKINTKKVLNKV